MILLQQGRSLLRSCLTVPPPEISISTYPVCPNTGTQYKPRGNCSTPGLTSPQCWAPIITISPKGAFSFSYLLSNLDGSPEAAVALLLTLHRLVALTFIHTAARLVSWDPQTHNHSSDCPRLPGLSDNQLFPCPHLQRPTSASQSPRSVHLLSG